MSKFDIRNSSNGAITEIIVSDGNPEYATITSVHMTYDGAVGLYDEDMGSTIARIDSKEDAEYLIAGIQKAIELGWFKK